MLRSSLVEGNSTNLRCLTSNQLFVRILLFLLLDFPHFLRKKNKKEMQINYFGFFKSCFIFGWYFFFNLIHKGKLWIELRNEYNIPRCFLFLTTSLRRIKYIKNTLSQYYVKGNYW